MSDDGYVRVSDWGGILNPGISFGIGVIVGFSATVLWGGFGLLIAVLLLTVSMLGLDYYRERRTAPNSGGDGQ